MHPSLLSFMAFIFISCYYTTYMYKYIYTHTHISLYPQVHSARSVWCYLHVCFGAHHLESGSQSVSVRSSLGRTISPALSIPWSFVFLTHEQIVLKLLSAFSQLFSAHLNKSTSSKPTVYCLLLITSLFTDSGDDRPVQQHPGHLSYR